MGGAAPHPEIERMKRPPTIPSGALALALLVAAVPVARAEKADRNKPINVEADRMQYDDLKQINVFTGNVTLTGIALADTLTLGNGTLVTLTPTLTAGDTNTNGALDLAETWTYTASHTVKREASSAIDAESLREIFSVFSLAYVVL